MALCNSSLIDLAKLETQLLIAIEKDEKYKREDAAKFRAIEQSKTYEEFRNIVQASHLKPLDKHESLHPKEMKAAPWNRCAGKKMKTQVFERTIPTASWSSEKKQKLEETLKGELGHENFHLFWNLCRHDLKERLKLLEKAFLVENIFKDVHLSVDLIVDIMETLNIALSQHAQIEDKAYDLVIQLMMSICSTPRFSLHMLFLNEKERSAVNEVKQKVKLHLEMKEKQFPGSDFCISSTFLDKF